nr:MAG TPA: hypothetical protein [Caudoviricetes sp.]
MALLYSGCKSKYFYSKNNIVSFTFSQYSKIIN